MAHNTLLVGSPDASWREWLKRELGDRDLVCLDPDQSDLDSLGRVVLRRQGKVKAWRFIGSLDALRAPHVVLAALIGFLGKVQGDTVVLAPAYKATPISRHLATLIAQVVQPSQILMAEGCTAPKIGWPIGPESVALEPGFPPVVVGAQRRAHWLKLFEQSETHVIELDRVALEGTRLGTGEWVDPEVLRGIGLPATARAETAGGHLVLVTDDDLDDDLVGRAMDHFHCARVFFVRPSDLSGLLCSFARDSGEDFGMGVVESVDFGARRVKVHSTAVAPAPVRILRLGSLRLYGNGAEAGELKPWQV
ncbi:MAG: hypothetical protein H3C58_07175 [Fimbriimonadaceae bacterium]|nr:hypothetical protein [Fimbriimonadaceae bacterium]